MIQKAFLWIIEKRIIVHLQDVTVTGLILQA